LSLIAPFAFCGLDCGTVTATTARSRATLLATVPVKVPSASLALSQPLALGVSDKLNEARDSFAARTVDGLVFLPWDTLYCALPERSGDK